EEARRRAARGHDVSEDSRKIIETAKALEKRGLVDSAVQAFLRAGDINEAARALMAARRFAEAGKLPWNSLNIQPLQVQRLDPNAKKQVMKAAICFAQAGETQMAVDLYLALGDRQRAAEVLQKAGDMIGAARVQSQNSQLGASLAPATAAAPTRAPGA